MNKNKFLQAIDTLRLYRRSELIDEQGRRYIKDLYVDPLPGDHVLHTLLRPNTTFLIGRKGTGKSTIFQRAQEELNKDSKTTWAYIDIKTIFESSTSELVGKIDGNIEGALSVGSIRKINIFRCFIIELVKEIKGQIQKRVDSSLAARLKSVFSGSTAELFENLDDFLAELEDNRFLNATGQINAEVQGSGQNREVLSAGGSLSASQGLVPKVDAEVHADLLAEIEEKKSENFSEVFIRIFSIRDLILRLQEILSTLKLSHLYIFVDDFSELHKSDMEEIVDTLLAPFNNWSDEFIKLKVAVYPGRIHFGQIDRSKIDEVYLDIYRCYGRNDVSGMELKAVDFTKRILTERMKYFCSGKIQDYFDSDSEEFWRTLFYACLGNPRILGYILYYSFETNTLYDKRIGIKTIQNAARRYYEEKIEQSFVFNKFLHESFAERSSIFSLKELIEEIVKKSKELRTYRESKVMKELSGRPPTSHFHVNSEYDAVLSSLELNFFLTKYYEMKDRDGKEVSVYALNYGLCQQQTISFGRPREKREHRLYFVDRIFDYSPIISSYIKINQEIVCDNCNTKHDNDMLPALQAYSMLCPKCRIGKCKVVNLSKKYEKLINEVSRDTLLPRAELGILKTLHDERKHMFAKQIAAELDCSYQLVGRRGKHLAEKDLVKRSHNSKGRRTFEISDVGSSVYFNEENETKMNF